MKALSEMTERPKAIRCRAGVVAAETALTIPLLLLFGLCSADLARAVHDQQVVTNAARTAVERGATQQFTEMTRAAWEARVKAAAMAELRNMPGLDESEVSYTLSTWRDSDDVEVITVELEVPFRPVLNWPALATGAKLRSRAESRQFR